MNERTGENGKRIPERVIAAVMAEQWAILPDMLHTMIEIAHRANTVDPAAVLARRAAYLTEGETATAVDGVALIPVIGPIFPRANLFTEFSGGTSIDVLARDFGAALRDTSIRAIVLNIDSPGGAVSGVSEFAGMIKAARGVKPIVAYVAGTAASAAYWIASAAGEIVASDTAMLGSVGVVTQIRKADPDAIEIVSSQSPNKRIDASTDEGRAKIQTLIDTLADVFVSAVASNRKMKAEDVIERFDRGGMRVGKDAVTAGMADRIGSLETLIAGMNSGKTSRSLKTMNENTTQPAAAVDVEKIRSEAHAQGVAEGVRSENARAAGIRAVAIAGHDALIETMIADTSITVADAAIRVLAAEKSARAGVLASMQADAAPVAQVAAAAPPVVADVSHLPIEERCAAIWERDPKVRDEFGTLAAFTAYSKADAKGLIKILRKD